MDRVLLAFIFIHTFFYRKMRSTSDVEVVHFFIYLSQMQLLAQYLPDMAFKPLQVHHLLQRNVLRAHAIIYCTFYL